MNMEGITLAAIVHELNNTIIGARIEKIYQPEPLSIEFRLFNAGKNYSLILSADARHAGVFLVSEVIENPAVPPAFCMLLRKHLLDGRIGAVVQTGRDRIITIDIDVRGTGGSIETRQVIVECMGKRSNIILATSGTGTDNMCSMGGIIIDAIKRIGPAVSRTRQILPGKAYFPPPHSDRPDFSTINADMVYPPDASDTVSIEKYLINSMAGIGPTAAKELLWRAGISPQTDLKSLDGQAWSRLTGAIRSLQAELNGFKGPPTIVLDGDRLVAITAYQPTHLSRLAGLRTLTFPTLNKAAEYAFFRTAAPETSTAMTLRKTVTAELERLERKKRVLQQELAEAEQAETMKKTGDILMAYAALVPPGATSASLPDLYAEFPGEATVSIALNPQISAIENAQAYYAKYAKMKRAREQRALNLAECEKALEHFESILVSLDLAETEADLAEIRAELAAAGLEKTLKTAKKKALADKPPAPLKITLPDSLIIAGKNNRQNDFVTFRLAKPDDLWFHARNIPGSHVILKTGSTIPANETILLAARLAAFLSKGRSAEKVPVDSTLRRFVRKPAGSPPGFVIYEHQRTFYVAPLNREEFNQLVALTRQ